MTDVRMAKIARIADDIPLQEIDQGTDGGHLGLHRKVRSQDARDTVVVDGQCTDISGREVASKRRPDKR